MLQKQKSAKINCGSSNIRLLICSRCLAFCCALSSLLSLSLPFSLASGAMLLNPAESPAEKGEWPEQPNVRRIGSNKTNQKLPLGCNPDRQPDLQAGWKRRCSYAANASVMKALRCFVWPGNGFAAEIRASNWMRKTNLSGRITR